MNHLASIKLKARGGNITFISAYAPHGGDEAVERASFFDELQSFANRISAHGPKFICGDFNARLHHQVPGEESVVGPYVFGNPNATIDPQANRSLLVEFCFSQNALLANTFVEQPTENRVTYFDLAAQPLDAISFRSFCSS